MTPSQFNSFTEKNPLTALISFADLHHTGVIIVNKFSEYLDIEYVNDAFIYETNAHNESFKGQPLHFIYSAYTDKLTIVQLYEQIKNGDPTQAKVYIDCHNSDGYWCELSGHPIKNAANEVQYYLIHTTNITEYMHIHFTAELERVVYKYIEEETAFHTILEVICKKVEHYYFNKIHCAIFLTQNQKNLIAIGNTPEGYSSNLFVDKMTKQLNEHEALHSQYEKACPLNVNTYIPCHSNFCQEINVQGYSPIPLYNEHNDFLGLFYLFFKGQSQLYKNELSFIQIIAPVISFAYKYGEQQQTLRKLAYYDASLDIPNALYFTEQVKERVAEGKSGTFIIIQPGEYSHIVDFYSRSAGDQVLREIVSRLTQSAGEDAYFMGRLSTSAIIIASEESLKPLAHYETTMEHLSLIPYFIKDREVYITLKVGISRFGPGIDVDEGIRYADIGLSKARKENGTSFHVFEESPEDELRLAIDVLSQLTKAITLEQFTPHLQPKIDMTTGEISGFEALARWISPVLGSMSPAVFIPIAEDSGKIREIDQIILKKVLIWMRSRLTNGFKLYPVSVNVSPKHFYYHSFVEEFVGIVKEYEIDASLIIVEVTESAELVDFQKAKEVMTNLKRHGFECSIDDFGVGFSSLSYLQQLPFTEIKIDQSFINLIHNTSMSAVVQTIIHLANSLKMLAVAEGIESMEQYETLKSMGCHAGQGYYFYKPMPLHEVDTLLENI
ncbi:MAG: EAL domain-containing protein [Lysinibacillus sp.]